MLVYGREVRFSLSLELPSLELTQQLELVENDAMIVRLVELMELEETKNKAMNTL